MNRKTGTKKIRFTCEVPELDYMERPVPASKMLPEWYKKMPSYSGVKKEFTADGVNGTIKRCMPVFDMATSGYNIVLPCDVLVTLDALGLPSFTWSIEWKLVTEHDLIQLSTLKIPDEFIPRAFKWANPWIITTPKGWSTMFLPPSYNDDAVFQILPAIVDTDQFELSVQFPFFLRKGFEGVIKAGTPIAQVIPFKRESWEAEYTTAPAGHKMKTLQKHSRFFENRYKRTFWNKKEYK